VTFEQLVEYMRAASVVVTHAGVGSVAVALANGQRPVVVPRLQRYGEAVDDHQLMLGRRLAQNGLVTLVEEPETLGELELESAVLPHPGPMSANLVDDLSAHIHKFVQARESFSKLRNGATVSGGGRGNWLRPR
jgi:UDP-N-acetylglucosamine transferase subunit ALG13